MDNRPRRPQNGQAPRKRREKAPADDGFFESLKELFSKDNLRILKATAMYRIKSRISSLSMHAFYSRERIICAVVCTVALIFFALLQTTIFSTLRPFGSIPDIMISFVIAVSVTEGERWGAVWGIIAAVIIEALGVSDYTLLPLLYMPVGYVGGILCKHYFTGSAAVRAVMTLCVLPLRGIFTTIYMILSPLYATAGEIFFDVVVPEIFSTLLLAAPVHLIMYLCLRPFHKTRAEMVSEK